MSDLKQPIPMEADLEKIKALLTARFPKCEVKAYDHNGVEGECCGSNTATASVYFPSIGDQLCVLQSDCSKDNVGMFVLEHVKSEDFKDSSYHLDDFDYVSPEHLVEQMVVGAEMMLEKERQWDKEMEEADKEWGGDGSIPPLCPPPSPELEQEVYADGQLEGLEEVEFED